MERSVDLHNLELNQLIPLTPAHYQHSLYPSTITEKEGKYICINFFGCLLILKHVAVHASVSSERSRRHLTSGRGCEVFVLLSSGLS
jgi:hypothetical protein